MFAIWGRSFNLSCELDNLGDELSKLGLKWKVIPKEGWHDYREIDVVVALRPKSTKKHFCKPATRLYNAWIAGVPAILPNESAYFFERGN